MNYRLTILPQARADVRRNVEWWAQHHSPEQAARWLDEGKCEGVGSFFLRVTGRYLS